ncbi:GNAT family N-acetyltransferase [Streptococcus parasuis]|uniref:GNAT family N-acetyltransferase n=1 Tax=Streptococcus parasuis TaxID=1501662 RepID=UPI0028A7A4A6|nr:GNAT family N-acetyltransferase [Streptococcus parasuis]
MEIRFAKFSDLEQVVELEQANFSSQEQISEAVLATYLDRLQKTCLVMENNGELVGFILSCPCTTPKVTDAIFYLSSDTIPVGNYLAIASLSVSKNYQGQGIGTLLIAALKEVALQEGYVGIALTCKEVLVGYYEINHFTDFGPSESEFGGTSWFDMYWNAL